MANMSYCRFENTLKDLEDCVETLNNDLSYEIKQMSDSEKEALRSMLDLAEQLVEKKDDVLSIIEENEV